MVEGSEKGIYDWKRQYIEPLDVKVGGMKAACHGWDREKDG